MSSILVSITSYQPHKENFLKKIIKEYIESYSCDNKITFILSVNYPLEINYPNIIFLNKKYEGWEYCWNNKEWIFNNYQNYDYIIESDDDVLIKRSNYDYYVEATNFIKENISLPHKYIIGFGIGEYDANKILKIINIPINTSMFFNLLTIKNRLFGIPNFCHSAGFIIDKKRYGLAIKNGIDIYPSKVLPSKKKNYSIGEWARTNIYVDGGFTKIIDISQLDVNSSFIHLPNKYVNIRYFPEASNIKNQYTT